MAPRWLVVALLAFSPSVFAARRDRVAVVVVGDPDGAATLGDFIERRLSAAGSVQSVTVARVGPQAVAVPAVDGTAQLAAAVDRFYANQVGDALADLAAIERALAEPSPATYRLRLELALWRAAVLERQWTSSGRAEPVPASVQDAVRAVLQLDPSVRVSMETFWPRFAALIEDERRMLQRHELRLQGLPAGALAWLDGRPIGHRVEAIRGRYLLQIAADGFVTSFETIDIHADIELVRPLSRIVPPEIAVAIGEAMARGDAGRVGQQARRIAMVERADVIVVIVAEPDHGRVAVVRGAAAQRSPRLEHAALVDWIVRSVTRDDKRTSSQWQLTARLGGSGIGTSLSWGDSEIESERSGGGLSVELTGQRSSLLARVGAGVSYDAVVTARSRGIDTPPTSARAGWLATTDLRIGTRLGGGRISFVPWLRVGLRSHRTGAFVFATGEEPLISGFTAIGLGGAATLQVQLASRVAIEVTAALDPLAVYLEKPARGTANPPEIGGGNALVAVRLRSGWVGEVGASYERIEIQYVGATDTIVTPAPVDARRLDEAFLFSLGARYLWGP